MFAAASPETTERYLTAVYLSQRAQSVELCGSSCLPTEQCMRLQLCLYFVFALYGE